MQGNAAGWPGGLQPGRARLFLRAQLWPRPAVPPRRLRGPVPPSLCRRSGCGSGRPGSFGTSKRPRGTNSPWKMTHPTQRPGPPRPTDHPRPTSVDPAPCSALATGRPALVPCTCLLVWGWLTDTCHSDPCVALGGATRDQGQRAGATRRGGRGAAHAPCGPQVPGGLTCRRALSHPPPGEGRGAPWHRSPLRRSWSMAPRWRAPGTRGRALLLCGGQECSRLQKRGRIHLWHREEGPTQGTEVFVTHCEEEAGTQHPSVTHKPSSRHGLLWTSWL